MPPWVLFLHLKLTGRHNTSESAPSLAIQSYIDTLEKHGESLSGRHVLELGSGRFARGAIQLIAHGAKCVTLVDPFALHICDPAHEQLLRQDCDSQNLDWDHIRDRIEVVRYELSELVPSHVAPIDLIISHSVLEHVVSPKDVFVKIAELLRPGGTTLHFIDLRDHNFAFRHPFEMLKYSDFIWTNFLNLRGGFHVNRFRLPHYLSAIEKTGLGDVDFEITDSDLEQLCEVYDQLAPNFKSIDQQTLAALKVSLFARKLDATN